MAESKCERCAALNPSINGLESNASPPRRTGNLRPVPPVDNNRFVHFPNTAKNHANSEQIDSESTSNGDIEKPTEPEKDEEKGENTGPPASVGFFHSTLSKLRLELFGLWARTVLILCVFILCVLSIYWAVLYHVDSNISSLNVFVVDFDGTQPPYLSETPLIGPMITSTTEERLRSPDPHLGYITLPPSHFDNSPLNVRNAIYDFKAYAAIVINPNATALLRAAVATGNASYDPLGACQLIWLEARDQDTYYDYILPELSALLTTLVTKIGTAWTTTVLQNSSIPRSNLAAAPQALSPAIGFSQYSLRPFNPPVVTPAVSVGLIYLIIIAFFSFSFFLPIYTKLIDPPSPHRPIPFYQLILVRYIGTNLAYFFLSLCYSLIPLAFRTPFAHPAAPSDTVSANPSAYGHGSWPVYWMINFLGMSALGLACENVAMVVGQPWTALWLIFWVITNVSTSFYSLDLAPKWYYWGYAWPLHNIVEASRGVVFDLHSRLGLNLGVLGGWVVVNSVVFPGACWVMRWKGGRGK